MVVRFAKLHIHIDFAPFRSLKYRLSMPTSEMNCW